MGFPGYFLIVADFIKWAKEQDIPVGPGRGSGAGSVVAWSLTITDLDPIRLGLLFERFLNPERVSMPDFDIDFCETRRGEVIRYVQERYGADRVAQIITFGKLKARAVLKDTGRVLQMPYGQVDRLAKLIPNHPTDPWTLERALNGVSELAAEYKDDREVRRLFDLAMKLEGFPRHSSTHAAGVVIADRPLDQLVPLYRDPRSDMPVTQFDMKYVEAAGLVKFDFLGLKTLSVLQKAVQLLAARGIEVDLDRLMPWDDPAVYALLQKADTVGVFQLESEGMRRTLAAVRPSNFGDIIALVALYRPGPMDNIPMFGDRKNGRGRIEYPHPLLEGLLQETYGIFVYQEQVMEAAKILAGYSLGEADLLRRAMGKKIKSEMDAQRAGFVAGCERVNGILPGKANELFDLIDKFAGYGFNKSHAAAYALVAYQTAWLKAHHPVEFYAASMCFDMHQTDKLAIFTDDMRRMDHVCLPPSINDSEAEFSVEEHGEGLAVRYALGALKGVGEKAMAQLVEERRLNGPFASLDDFAARIDPRLLNRRQIESLAGGGAFDEVAARWQASAAAETILAAAASAADMRSSGQGGLFGEGPANVVPIRMPTGEDWTLAQRMAAEKESFGFYFSAHPVDNYRHLAMANGARTFAELAAMPAPAESGRVPATMAGLVEDTRLRTSAKGRRYMMATLSDSSGQFEATVFDDACRRAGRRCRQSRCLRPARRRTGPPPRRGDAARHDQVAVGLRGPGETHPPADRGRGRGPGGARPARGRDRAGAWRQRPAAPEGEARDRRGPARPRPRLHRRRRARRAHRAHTRHRRRPSRGRRGVQARFGLLSERDCPLGDCPFPRRLALASRPLIIPSAHGRRGSPDAGRNAGLGAAHPAADRPCRARAWRARDRHPLGGRHGDPDQLGGHPSRCEEAGASP